MPRVRTHHFPQSAHQPQVIREIVQQGPGLSEIDAFRIASKAVEIYATRHPRPPHVTYTQAAEMLGISRPTLKKRMALYRVKLNKFGMIPIEEIDRMLAMTD
ncbi:helix-turn-helix domain-containing protein [Burkholderia ambifaria]|uniref:helix-turn-helix domain-containing protein n=1 Tax=Burkholderia ambifaria TaxID=152480 RepID=UPI00158CDC27|nr:helix-turn-helix domain-containing protein [Burkholderia ambifaria]